MGLLGAQATGPACYGAGVWLWPLLRRDADAGGRLGRARPLGQVGLKLFSLFYFSFLVFLFLS
jgi:hypothetical protein